MSQRVLIAEDSPTQAAALLGILESEGYDAATVADGQAALAALRSEPWAILLADLTMPGLSGSELMRAVRADPELCHIPIVVMSGLEESTSDVRAVRAIADGWLAKPIDVAALLRMLDELINRP